MIRSAFLISLVLGAGIAPRPYVDIRPVSCGIPIEREVQRSPKATWVAGRYIIDGDCSAGVMKFALRRADDGPVTQGDFFLSLPAVLENHALFKWIDDAHLLIATLQQGDLPEAPDHFKDVQLSYSFYSDDPDQAINPATQIVIERHPQFRYRFERTNGWGLLGAWCQLFLEAEDEKFVKEVAVRLTAGKTFAHKELNLSKGLREVPEVSEGSMLVSVHQDYEPIRYVTAARYNSLHLTIAVDRNFSPIKTPNGGLAPSWQTQRVIEALQLKSALEDIRTGNVNIRLGFWLDNLELIYKGSPPKDLTAIKDFENCMSEAAIFNDRP
jgi:hypothetical protein